MEPSPADAVACRSPELGWRVRIAGMGRYLPRRRVASAEIEARIGVREGWSLAHSGVAFRHWADPSERASWMGAQAAMAALQQAGVDPAGVDLIINASGSAERAIPDGGPMIQQEMGLGESGIPSFSVHATCLSFIAALEIAAERIHQGRVDRALVVSSEIASVALDFDTPEVCTLFGDGAVAWLLERAPTDCASAIHRIAWMTNGLHRDLTTVRGCGSFRHPHSSDTLHGDALFQMEGRATLRQATRLAPQMLARLGLDAEQRERVRWIAPHQA
ncbi:ketoacyl-ACP synthase III, partial [Cognatilysobacter lacus]